MEFTIYTVLVFENSVWMPVVDGHTGDVFATIDINIAKQMAHESYGKVVKVKSVEGTDINYGRIKV